MRFWIWFPENFVQNAGWSPWMNWFAYEVGIRKGLYFFKVHRSQHPSLNSTNFPAWDGITIYILQITILKNILRVVKNPATVREIIWREPCWPLPSIVKVFRQGRPAERIGLVLAGTHPRLRPEVDSGMEWLGSWIVLVPRDCQESYRLVVLWYLVILSDLILLSNWECLKKIMDWRCWPLLTHVVPVLGGDYDSTR